MNVTFTVWLLSIFSMVYVPLVILPTEVFSVAVSSTGAPSSVTLSIYAPSFALTSTTVSSPASTLPVLGLTVPSALS